MNNKNSIARMIPPDMYIEDYDIKNELLGETGYVGNSPLDRWGYYKNNAKKHSFDCDSSYYALEMYNALYEHYEFEDAGVPNRKSKLYTGDTMTSAWVPLKNYFKVVLGDSLGLVGGAVPKSFRKGTTNIDTWLKYVSEKTASGAATIDDYVEEFISLNHTIGNMLPVPKQFNVARAGRFASADSWDLTLTKILRYYLIGTPALEELFYFENKSRLSSTIKYASEWLESFGNWQGFIEANYLQDFVDENGPIMFFEGHSYKNMFPRTADGVKEYFTTCSKLIKLRNRRLRDVYTANYNLHNK